MEILKNLLSTFKEILYDTLGYLVPGLFIFSLVFVPYTIKEYCSLMYAIYEIILDSNVSFNISSINSNMSFFSIFYILFLAYLLGHISISIGSFLGYLYKKSLAKIKLFKFLTPESAYKELCENILKILKRNPKFGKDLFAYTIKEKQIDNENSNNGYKYKLVQKYYNEKFISTFASTYSRFSSHNDLIQKYICKINFYKSLSCIFFILMLDSIISFFVFKFLNHSIYINFWLNVFPITCFLLICFLTFINQYNKHYALKTKEAYLFLYNYFDCL